MEFLVEGRVQGMLSFGETVNMSEVLVVCKMNDKLNLKLNKQHCILMFENTTISEATCIQSSAITLFWIIDYSGEFLEPNKVHFQS